MAQRLNPTFDQIEKLPKWAQTHIERLERKVSDAERTEKQLRFELDPETSNTFTDVYTNGGVPLGRDPSVRFKFDPREGLPREQCWADVRLVEDRGPGGQSLQVMTSDLLVIRAHSSNLVTLRSER